MKNELRLPFYLAWQTLRRGRKWTMSLTVVLLSVAFINLIFVSALFNGIIAGSNQQIRNTLTGNVYISPRQGQSYINNKDELLAEISYIPGVDAVTSSFQLPARIEKDSRSGRWPLLAINPDEYSKVINIAEHIFQGKYLEADDTDGILLGRQIAGGENLELNSSSLKGASVGDVVNVVFDGLNKSYTVRGIFYTKFTESDARAFITTKALNKIMPEMDNHSTAINIKTPDRVEEKVFEEVNKIDSNNDTFLWTEAAGLMKSVSSSFTSINVLLTFVGVIIAAVTIFIVVYVDIINKRKQIGILRAIGIRSYIIVLNYVILAAVYASLGILLGSAIFYLGLVPYFQSHPFVLPITDAVLVLKWPEYITRVQIVSWVAVISGLIPALIVTRAKMLDAILGK